MSNQKEFIEDLIKGATYKYNGAERDMTKGNIYTITKVTEDYIELLDDYQSLHQFSRFDYPDFELVNLPGERKTVPKIIEFIFDHILELNCLILIMVSLFPLLLPEMSSGMNQALCGGMIGIAISFYPFRDMGLTSLFRINSSIYLAVILLMGMISIFIFCIWKDFSPPVILQGWERMFATYLGFIITYIGIYVGKSIAGK